MKKMAISLKEERNKWRDFSQIGKLNPAELSSVQLICRFKAILNFFSKYTYFSFGT